MTRVLLLTVALLPAPVTAQRFSFTPRLGPRQKGRLWSIWTGPRSGRTKLRISSAWAEAAPRGSPWTPAGGGPLHDSPSTIDPEPPPRRPDPGTDQGGVSPAALPAGMRRSGRLRHPPRGGREGRRRHAPDHL